MRMNNMEELLRTVENIRKEKYPHIPKELVEKIIEEEFLNQDSRTNASEKVSRLISENLDKQGE